ncbi:MAG TPA: DMT family transporter [Acidimicrobiales bacterium]
MRRLRRSGMLLCLGSATAFGGMAVFGKLAYDNGATVGTLLAVRFALAAALFWVLILARGGATEVRSLARCDVALALALGGGIYAAQAGGYFAALARIDASLLSLLVYTFPAMVAVVATVRGRDRLDRRRTTALVLAVGGVGLVLAGAGVGALDPLGTALGLGTAVVYAGYVLVSEGVAARVRPQVLAALVATGAAGTLTAASALLGELRPGALTGAGWAWLACIAVVSTVGAVGLFFAGVTRVGATTASIVSTAEPVVTVLLALAVFGETLGGVQMVGAGLVVGGILVVQT